jgi:hypothetical protein
LSDERLRAGVFRFQPLSRPLSRSIGNAEEVQDGNDHIPDTQKGLADVSVRRS